MTELSDILNAIHELTEKGIRDLDLDVTVLGGLLRDYLKVCGKLPFTGSPPAASWKAIRPKKIASASSASSTKRIR